MSFSQPFCDLAEEPADEWKLILAGTFTAMGLMILGMYAWISQDNTTEDIGPLSIKKEPKDKQETSLFFENTSTQTL
ncbi:hypothetical protein AVEN_223540-1 [Araneus ventricosus]|uniref:Uncharacterized protein n=1 Tax=Araneus ventricosus TaxID=182803 RepID=A0A4Y2ULW7_ARAVE|nr:hypothetical protein AVEN_223540-1 [Araneus ventricosus]